MMYIKRLTAALLTVTIIAALAACGGSDPGNTGRESAFPGTVEEDMVTLNITSEPMSLDPMHITDVISQCVLAHSMAGFTRLDAEDRPVADMAESWEISADNTVYTMHLRKDAKWSNGDPVTVRDFYYSWVMQMTPATGTVYASSLYNNIKNGEAFYNGEVSEAELGLKVLDDYTMTIEWSHPVTEANGLFYLTQPFFLPVNQKVYEEIGSQQYAKDVDKMVTNGPYRIAEWVHDDHIILEKSSDYFDKDFFRIPRVKLVMIGDSNTSLNAFMVGEIDLSNLYSEQISQVKQKSEQAVQSYADGGSWFINFNTQDENLSNLNLRKALAYSIDVQSLLDHVINDGSVAADGLVPGVIAGADGRSYAEARGSLFGYDKEAAVQYLDQALQELGKTKEELKLVFWGSDTTYNKNQAAYLQQQWKENLGLDVQLKSLSVKALTEAQYNGEYDFLVDGLGPTDNDAMGFLENYVTDNLNNTPGFFNAEYDSLIQEAMQEGDAGRRQDLMIQAEQVLINNMVVGPMYFSRTTYAISDKLKGVARTPFQFFGLRDASIEAE